MIVQLNNGPLLRRSIAQSLPTAQQDQRLGVDVKVSHPQTTRLSFDTPVDSVSQIIRAVQGSVTKSKTGWA